MISTTILTQNLSNNHNVLSALNLFSVSQKFIWHSYCCMSNITLAFKHPSFFFLCSFFYDYFYISLNVFLLWIPQIVHNIIRNNKFSFPLFYLIGNTLDRIIIPFYFRGFEDNFISVRKNLSFIIIIIAFILLCILI